MAPDGSGTLTPNDLTRLRDLLAERFTLDDIKSLCFDLRVDYDELPGDAKTPKIESLLHNMNNAGRLPELLAKARATRPQVDWPQPGALRRDDCPYRGLFAFREADAANFFGRDDFAQRLAQAAPQRPLVAVVGASGSGKSSVVFAGLLPRLRAQGRWLITDFRPGNDPFYNLAAALVGLDATLASRTARLDETRRLADALRRPDDPLPLADLLADLLREREQATRLLLIADQFEELYTLCPDLALRRRFLDTLLDAFDAQKQGVTAPRATLVLTLRADFLGQALAYRPFADALDAGNELLGPMNRPELAAAITRPAARLGVRFEAGLVERILDDVGAEPGNLPLLEFALEKLWAQQSNGRLTHVGYEQVGCVQGALAAYADEVYARLSVAEQEQARRALVQLVHPGAGTEDTRRLATQSEVGAAIWPLVKRLADARLLVTDQDESGRETVEVVHEALIKRWERLQRWMAEDRVFREWQERLRAALRGWEASGRDEGALLRGAPLVEAEGWLVERSAVLSNNERDFVTFSLALREQKTREEEARQQRELEQARALAQAERKRSQIFRRSLFGTLILLTVAVAVTVYAFFSQQKAERQKRIAVGQALAAQSALEIERSGEAELAALLAIQAVRFSGKDAGRVSWLADGSLRKVLDYYLFRNTAMSGHQEVVSSLAYSPDGRWLASGSADYSVRLWSLDSLGRPNQESLVLGGHENRVSSVSYSPNGRWLVSSSEDKTVRMWFLDEEGKPKSGVDPITLIGHEGSVFSVAYSSDGRWLASGSEDQTIRVWALDEDGQPKSVNEPIVLNGHTGTIWAVAYSPDRRWLASGSEDNTVRLWPLDQDGYPQHESIVLSDHNNEVLSLAFSPDAETLASGGGDLSSGLGEIRLWNMEDLNTPSIILPGNEFRVWSVAYSPDGRWLAGGAVDRKVRVWALDDHGSPLGEAPVVLSGHQQLVRSVTYSPNGHWLASGSKDHVIRLWELNGDGNPQVGIEPTVLRGHEYGVWSAAFSPNGRWLVSGSADRTVRMWSLDGEERLNSESAHLGDHKNGVLAVAYSSDGKWLASGSADQTIQIWLINDEGRPSGRPVLLEGHTDWVWSIDFSPNCLSCPDKRWLASGSADGTVRLWPINDSGSLEGAPVVLESHQGSVRSVAYSPNGRWLASGSDGGNVRLWPLDDEGYPSGEPIILDGHENWVWSVAYSPDGRWLASGSNDRTVRVWALNGKGYPIREPVVLSGHELGVLSVAYSPDGRWLASGSDDKTVRVWPLDENGGLKIGAEPVRLVGHTDRIRSVAYSPDGRWLATGSHDTTVRIWLSPEAMVDLACQLVQRNLSWEEWQLYLGNEPYAQACLNLPLHPSVP